MASSISNCWNYDVFLNFRGKDTLKNFTSYLYHALIGKGINTFIDNDLERGQYISPSLLQVIESSRISILVLSQYYASSSYCLDELVKIIECKVSKGQIVLPIFYHVDPTEVEEQSGKYGEAFAQHEIQFGGTVDRDKLQKWRLALAEAATLPGWPLDANGNEAEFIQTIAKEVSKKLDRNLLHVADNPVGLDFHIEEISRLLNIGSNDVCMVGICGMGGIGKTMIAKAIYNKYADQFEGSCFLFSVKDRSKRIVELQEILLLEILGKKRVLMGNCDRGIMVIKERLCNKTVLIAIDDVDHVEQLRKLAGEPDWFGKGSRIIITTRDEHLLATHGVQLVHRVEGLSPSNALTLFCWKAFRQPQPRQDFVELSHQVVDYAQGLPLALIVLGSSLCERSVCQWKSEVQKLKRIPNKEISRVLKISYENLDDDEKEIFLDIACFFNKKDKDLVIEFLESCDFYPNIGVQILIEKSLISIEENQIKMHDLLQSLGREIVYQESPMSPCKRSRLWFHEDVVDVLTETKKTNEIIEGLMLDLPENQKDQIILNAEVFTKLKRLRILIVQNAHFTGYLKNLPSALRWLEWPGYPSESLPSGLNANKLLVLDLSSSCIKQLGDCFKNYRNLTHINFTNCMFLTEIPDVSTIRSVMRLNLALCGNLEKVHESVGFLEKLVFLNFFACSKLRSLPRFINLRSLQLLVLGECKKLDKLPEIVGSMTSLEELDFQSSGIKELPLLNEKLSGLRRIILTENLARIPTDIHLLQHLEVLCIKNCLELGKFLENVTSSAMRSVRFSSLETMSLRGSNLTQVDFLIPACFPKLRVLDLSENNFVTLPTMIRGFTKLTTLNLEHCIQLREIPELPQSIEFLSASNCKSLERCLQLIMNMLKSGNVWISRRKIKCMYLDKVKNQGQRWVDFSNCHRYADNLRNNLLHILLESALLPKHGFPQENGIRVVLPGSEIPEWINYKSEGRSVCFQVLSDMFQNINGLIICAIINLSNKVQANFQNTVIINGKMATYNMKAFISGLASQHLWLSYVPCHDVIENIMHYSLENSWINRFEVSFKILSVEIRSELFEQFEDNPSSFACVERCGVSPLYRS